MAGRAFEYQFLRRRQARDARAVSGPACVLRHGRRRHHRREMRRGVRVGARRRIRRDQLLRALHGSCGIVSGLGHAHGGPRVGFRRLGRFLGGRRRRRHWFIHHVRAGSRTLRNRRCRLQKAAAEKAERESGNNPNRKPVKRFGPRSGGSDGVRVHYFGILCSAWNPRHRDVERVRGATTFQKHGPRHHFGRFSVTSACFCPYLKVNGGRYRATSAKITRNDWIL